MKNICPQDKDRSAAHMIFHFMFCLDKPNLHSHYFDDCYQFGNKCNALFNKNGCENKY